VNKTLIFLKEGNPRDTLAALRHTPSLTMRLTQHLNNGTKVELLRQIAVFLCVGGFATALHYSIMFGLLYGAHWPATTASATGFVISAIVNFALNARLTFKSEQSVLHTAPRFAIVCALGLALNQLVLTTLLSLGSHPIIGQIIATLCVLSWNYIINALWTFNAKRS
jgi:putative flippase GtrA